MEFKKCLPSHAALSSALKVRFSPRETLLTGALILIRKVLRHRRHANNEEVRIELIPERSLALVERVL